MTVERSLCDQIYGDDGRHLELRQEVCQFMIDHEADFAPFIDEEDGTFAQYSLSMIRV
jgi:OTU domain-containing protein 3